MTTPTATPPSHAPEPAPHQGFSRRDIRLFVLVGLFSAVTFGLKLADASATLLFVLSGIAVALLAYVLGDATEQAGESAGPRVAALLNATFGNAPELIIVILTIREGLLDVARASIAGSVLGNVLFILGASIFFGGLKNGPMRFNSRTAGVNASMLVLAVIALGVPTLFASLGGTTASEERTLSYGVAGVMLVLYVAYLIQSFQHPEQTGTAVEGHGAPRWSARAAITVLAVTAVVTGILSEVLVESIKPTIESTGISEIFIGIIIVPIVGNIAEHLAAVKIAYRGNLDFSMGIAFNSALQVALLITAVAVFSGAIIGNELSIVFPPLEIALLGGAAVMAGLISADGEVTWLEGLELLAIYALAGYAFWFL